MKLAELLSHLSERLDAAREATLEKGLDAPVLNMSGRLKNVAGTLYLYEFNAPTGVTLAEDTPVTVLPQGDLEPTEGVVVGCRGATVLVQTLDGLGQDVGSCTLVPDAAGFLEAAARRLAAMAKHPEQYCSGPGERLVPWLDPDQPPDRQAAKHAVSTSVLTTIWSDDLKSRRVQLASLAVELVRANKRLLLITSSPSATDEVVGVIARSMRGAGLQFVSLLSQYEMPLSREAAGMPLAELGFEAQMHRFYAKSRNDKAALRRKYERFRELTPLLAYKAEKQRDLDEVKLLEWRLLTQLSDLQGEIKEIDHTLTEYERLPLWKRLSMQAAGKNVSSLAEYRQIYDGQVKAALTELEVAKARIAELRPEAAIPKDLKPEYQELKEEVVRLGGTKKIRELLAAGEGTNRQAFIQNKRLVATTARRIVMDPLFERVRFDVLLVDEADKIASPYLLAAAGLVRERIIISADQRSVPSSVAWASLEEGPVGEPSVL